MNYKAKERWNNEALTFHLSPGVHSLKLTTWSLADFPFLSSNPSPRSLWWSRNTPEILIMLAVKFSFHSWTLIKSKTGAHWSIGDCFRKQSLIIPLECTHTHICTHLPHVCVSLRSEFSYRRTKWSASRQPDGPVLSPLINFKAECEMQRLHANSRPTAITLLSTSTVSHPRERGWMN